MIQPIIKIHILMIIIFKVFDAIFKEVFNHH